MGRRMLRRKKVTSIELRAGQPGSRAVFLVEARNTEEQRRVRDLFGALAEMADVAPLCEGAMMAYVVQLGGVGDGCSPAMLFSKIEVILKEEFSFSLVERSFNEVVYHLVESLSADCSGRMPPIPRCGICCQPEPFPTRITLRDESGRGIIEACYCLRCAAQRADPDDREFVTALLLADRQEFRAIRDANLIEWQPGTEAAFPLPTYRIAS